MIPSPPAFDGSFSEFFDSYIGPNLPSPERVREFDIRFRRYLAGPDPAFPVRAVRGQDRGRICQSNHGQRMLPTDNAPVWWLHAFLLSEEPFPKEDTSFFDNLPFHMFSLPRRRKYLNSAGYHAAHIVNAKNGDTNWRNWTREEICRRSLVNIHPCNMVLVSKPDWQTWGGNKQLLAWVTERFLDRYGDVMASFLSDVGIDFPLMGAAKDFHYYFPQTKMSKATPCRPKEKKPIAASKLKQFNRPLIRKDFLELGIELEITIQGRQYLVPHDQLVDWVGQNMNALNTPSWQDKGVYSWPRPSQKMLEFLRQFAV